MPGTTKIKAMGHRHDEKLDRMDVFLAESAGIKSIGEWSKCDLHLGRDFILFQKEQLEKETGQNVKVEGV